MVTAGEVMILINAKDEASGKIDGLGSKVTGLGPIAVAAGAAVAAGLIAGLGAAITKAGDLEQAVANISTIKPEIDTSQVFTALNEMQTRVPQSADLLGDALYDVFSSLDVPVNEGIRLVEQFAQAATGAGTDVKTFGTAAMGVMNAYGLSVADAAHISDVFFNTVNRGVVTGAELAASLGPVTQSAKAAGVSLDELGAMIAGVTKEGGPAAQNINNLNNLFMKITTKDAQAAIRGLGVATTDAAGNFRPILDVLDDVKVSLDQMSQEDRSAWLQKAFPDAQARQAAQTILSQLGFVRQALEENATSAGSTEAAYAKMSATFNSQLQLMQNTISSVFTQIGAEILPVITPLVTAFAQQLPGAIATVRAALTGLFDAVAPSIIAARDAIQPFVAAIMTAVAPFWDAQSAIQAVTVALGALAVAATAAMVISAVTNPIVLIVAAVSALSYGIIMLIKHWDEITQKVPLLGGVVSGVQAVLSGLGSFITGTVIPAVQKFVDFFGGPLPAIIAATSPLMAPLVAAWTHDLGGIQSKVGAVVDFVKSKLGEVIQFFGGPLPAAIALANPLFAPLVAAWSNDLGGIQGKVGAVVDFIKGKLGDLAAAAPGWWDAITSKGAEVWDAIQQAAAPVLQFLQEEGGKVAAFFETEWPKIEQAAGRVFDAITALAQPWVDGLRAIWEGLVSAANDVWTRIQGDVEGAWNAITNVIKMALDGARILWEQWGPTITQLIENTWNGIKIVVSNAVDAVLNSIMLIVNLINGDYDAAWKNAQNIVQNAWRIIEGFVETGVKNVVTIIKGIADQLNLGPLLINPAREMVDGFVSAVRGKISDAVAVGRALVDGIRQGVRDAAGALLAEARNLVNQVVNTLADAAKAKSPSRETAEKVGVPLAEGIAVGMDEATPTVIASAVALTDAAIEAAAGSVQSMLLVGTMAGTAFAQGMATVIDRSVTDIMNALSQISAEGARIQAEAEVTDQGQTQLDALIAKAAALQRALFYAKNPGGVFVYGLQAGITIPTYNHPYLAEGGVVPAQRGGGAYMLGDGGEAEAVIPLSQLGSVIGGREAIGRSDYMGSKIEIHIHAPEGVVGDTGIRKLAEFAGEVAERRVRGAMGDMLAAESRRVW